MMPLQNTMTKIDIPIVMHTDDTINCFADLQASSFFPGYLSMRYNFRELSHAALRTSSSVIPLICAMAAIT